MRRPGPNLKRSDAEIAGLAEAARCVVEIHHAVARTLRIGVTLAEVDALVADTLRSLGARSCFKGYKVGKHPPFPSHACLSVNDCVVHGHVGSYTKPMRPGDVLKIDVGVLKDGWIGDAAWSYAFGQPADEVARLMDCGKRSLDVAIPTLRPGNKLIDWPKALQPFVESVCRFKLIRGLGGHGYGRSLHEPPYISNTTPLFLGEWPEAHQEVREGLVVAVEPMIATGSSQVEQTGNAWPMHTADGSQSVHYEADVLVTAEGPRVLTAGLEDVNDVIDR